MRGVPVGVFFRDWKPGGEEGGDAGRELVRSDGEWTREEGEFDPIEEGGTLLLLAGA